MMLEKLFKVKLNHWLAGLWLLTVFLRIPSLFEPYWYGDEGIYLTIGQALRKGWVLYRDIYDNKPPLLYLVAALAQSQVWFRLILLWWNLVNIYFIYLLAFKIFKKESPALFCSFLFILFSLIPEGNIANGEIFMILPTTAAMLLLYKIIIPAPTGISRKKNYLYKSRIKYYYFLSGVLFSIAFLFKSPAGFSFAAALIFLLFFSNQKKFFNFKIEYLIFTGGFIFLPLLLIFYYWLEGILPLYLRAAYFQNFGYLTSWEKGWHQPLFSLASGLTQRGLILAAIILGLWLAKKLFSKRFLLISLWFFLDLFASLLSGRPYPHYLIQVAPAFSLLLVFLLIKTKVSEKILAFLALIFLLSAFFYYRFWSYPVWRYYLNFHQFVTGQKSKENYFSFFDSRVGETYRVASLIKGSTGSQDRIFIWADEPYLYALTERLPVGRYTVAYHIIDFDGWEETAAVLKYQPPLFILKNKTGRSFPQLEKILAESYRPFTETERLKIFLKL